MASSGVDPVADLLHVYRSPETADETAGQKAARKLLREDYKTFMTLLLRGQGMVAEMEAASKVEAGPQEERVEELAERLLREWEEGEG